MIIFIIIGFLLMNNKCLWLISGYNTMTKEEKEKYDKKALCKFMSYLMFAIAACQGFIALGDYLRKSWIWILASTIMIVICIGAVIYCNRGNRFLK
nr:DUF3784 domain-containing protein [Clostridium beijerinckii]